MSNFRKTKLALAVSGSLVLTACGGGGGAASVFVRPGTVANTYSFSIPSFGAMFSAQQSLTEEDKKAVKDAVDIFKFVQNNSFDNLNVNNDKIIIDGVERTLEEGYQVLQGLSKQLYTESTKDFWNDVAATGVYDDSSNVYTAITNAMADVPNTPADMFDYFKDIGTGKEQPKPIVITDTVAETPTETPTEVTENDVTNGNESSDAGSTTESEPVPGNADVLTLLDTLVTATSDSVLSTSDPVVTTESIEETRVSTDANGSTVTDVYTVYTTTSVITVTTTTTVTNKQIKTWSDGSTTEEVVSTDVTTSTKDNVSVTQTEALKSRTVTANVASTADTDSSVDTITRGDAVVTTTSENETRTGLDENGSTVTEVWTVYTDTTTVPVTTTTTVTTTRTTTWTDGTTTSEVVNVSSTDATVDEVSTATRETLVSSTTTPNVVSTSTSQTSEDTVTRGDAVVTTTSTNETRTSLDENGSTVTEVYAVYTDTTTVPVTTTTVVTDYRTTLYTDGTSVTEPTNVTSTDVTVDEVTTATRETLLSRTVTANVASTSDAESTSTTTTVSDPVLQETIVNTDTRADGVWTFYYDVWVTTTTTTTTVTTTRTTVYTDGTSTAEVINTDTTETVTTAEQVKVRYTSPTDTTVTDPTAPDSTAGTTVTQANAPTLDYDPATYSASTYYNSTAMGTPTQVASHDPADFSTQEFDNGANSEINANYAYARGWTGAGSTVMIMDTGVDTDHADLVDKIKYQWEPGYDSGIEDIHGHGTHVAGIVAAAKNDSGTHGVAYDADLAIAKIGERSASTFYAKQALNWAKQYDDIVAANLSANMYNVYQNVVDHGNGIYTNDTDIDSAIGVDAWATAMPDELVLTMAAGNASNGYSAAPTPIATAVDADGNLKLDGRVLIVGNWNKTSGTIDGGQAGHVCRDYSNNTCNDAYVTSDFYILAPGIQVESTYIDGATKAMSGTSMASPVVAGAVAIVHQLWPYMKGENIAQLLLQTADKDLPNYSKVTHGAGLLDLDQATRPVGDLGISLTGRTGTTMPLSGSLSFSGEAALSSVSTVDAFDRDFSVDLTAAKATPHIGVNYATAQLNSGWAGSLASLNVQHIGDFRFGSSEDGSDLTLGYTDKISKNLDLTLSYTKTDTNPWVQMSGMFGETTGSETAEASVKYKFGKQIYAQVGLMNTHSQFKSGLVTDISDVQSAYATAGYKDENLHLYAGVKPYALSGKLDLRIPTGVDAEGNMQYTNSSSAISNRAETFIGLNYTDKLDELSKINYTANLDSTGDKQLGIQFTHRFW